MGQDADDIPFPFLALVVSGGHTELFAVESPGALRLLGQTQDDAVGELLDKVSAMLGYGYPGGAVLERLACNSGLLDGAARFPGRPFLPVPLRGSPGLDFSYSGLKTAVLRYLRAHAGDAGKLDGTTEGRLLACLFSVICDSIWDRVRLAIEATNPRALSVSGGVAINGLLRSRLGVECARVNLPLWFPQPQHCLDNAEMMLYLLALVRRWGRNHGGFDIASSWLPGDAAPFRPA
jgi:N6-L-threonylcarbamoyladenine synthase